ncbi:MAG: undecaprenyldiphospho-muramoylpentapeptide beta-N-acetylglucosaminyltransferase [Micrococcales bacterium]|nr:undecaprenyldiphospho-muramoylpentapeptide beta-N-acetylglucosaminyltransferase [Micrococcales bacterium]
MTNYLLAGGGTAGHVNPLLALADEIKKRSASNKVYALGTAEGLEARLVPQRGYELITVPRLPMPRKLNGYLFKFPSLFIKSVKQVEEYIAKYKIDVVVGFGGYASAPAYRAAKKMGIPYVIHEANALPGYANRVGARNAAAVAVSFQSTKLPKATYLGMPIRQEIAGLDRAKNRATAAKFFNLDPTKTTLLVTGGSLGARRINQTIELSRPMLASAHIQVLHIVGDRAGLEALSEGNYHRITYCDRMDLALAAVDFAVARSGAATVSEFAAVGLPAVFVPYPVGNGEQRFNATDLVDTGAALLVEDSNFDQSYVEEILIPLVLDSARVKQMSSRAYELGIRDGAARLLDLVNGVLKV